MGLIFLHILAAAFITEALTELVIKSVLFKPLRAVVSKWGSWFGELLSCGYCFSFWVAAVVVCVARPVVPMSGNGYLDLFFTLFIVQRLSNVIHNIVDKWTDKYYDQRYVNIIKD